ncbi:MAG TPA: beta-ketoacyl-[acyl-carrier-protein] synthase family protein, partial [Solirubrobacteraceae bacterium]|nr:beta-ketoacyl-[acyl-carrier-protein] synthase family protein [Solirubrobacteraceae bacterium]
MNRVVITGMGIVSSLGETVDAFLEGMHGNTVAIRPAPWVGDDGTFAWWSVVQDFDPLAWMDPKVAGGTDLFAQFALAAADQAVRDAGLDALDPLRTAVVHGTSMGGMRALLKAQHQLDTEGAATIERKTLIQMWPNMAASQIAMRFGLHGPQMTVCTACASSIDALGTAAQMLSAGRVDVAIVGGTEGGMPLASGEADGDFVPATFHGQALYGMTTNQRDPLRASLPFDRDRSGIVNGEGSAMLVLEREDHARARGARVLAELAGYGSLADGHHPSSPEPGGKWEAAAMHQALRDADLRPRDVDALVAHATATPKGDTAEIRAINAVHADRDDPLPVLSLKGHIGHTGAASGAMGAIVAIDAIQRGRLPNVAGTTDVDPEVEFRVVTGAP